MRNDSKTLFENLTVKHDKAVRRMAHHMTEHLGDAEDVVQDAYLSAYRFFDRFKRGTNFEAWMWVIVRNTTMNSYRKKKLQPASVDPDSLGSLRAKSIGTSQRKTDITLTDETKSALDGLPGKYRQVVYLADIHGFTYRQIARRTDCPEGTVMSRLFRARQLLRGRLMPVRRNG